jgi:serine/threonine protein kinase
MSNFTSGSHENRNALPIGYILNKQYYPYRIEKILGSGGFGITYQAYDQTLNCLVALKEYLPNDLVVRDFGNLNIYPKSSSDGENFNWGLRCFMQEAQTLAQFNHPNIVRIRTFFEELNTAYIVMDYEKGDSLDSLIQDGETAEENEIETILKPLLDGLALVHEAKFLHRDIKPANIYIRSQDNSPVLLDFGSARYDVSSRSRSITAIVTPGYAPFEQYESKGTMQGAWTDIYAMGAVLYRLISAKSPPEASERAGAIMRNQPDPLIPAVKIGKGRYSKHLLEAIDWALKINETERPQTIAAWREKLFSKPKPINYFAVITFLLLISIGAGGGYFVFIHEKESSVDVTDVIPPPIEQIIIEQPNEIAQPDEEDNSVEILNQPRIQQDNPENEMRVVLEDAKHKIQQILNQAKRNISSSDRENQVNNIAHNAISEIQQIQNQFEQVAQTAINAIAEIQSLQRQQIVIINERCTDGRLNASQIRKLVTGKIAVGKRIADNTSWKEGQASGGNAFFQREGGNRMEGKWKISDNSICWCYGTCQEYSCKYVEASNNCSVWYYIDIESGQKTGQINRWIDY